MNEKLVQIVHPESGVAWVFESTLPVWTQIGWVVQDVPVEVPVAEPDTPIFNEVSGSTGMTESVQEPVSGPDSV